MNFLDTPDKRDRRVVHLPLGRFGEAIEQARAALFRTSLFIPMLASHSHLKWISRLLQWHRTTVPMLP